MSSINAKYDHVRSLLESGEVQEARVACQRLVQSAPKEPALQSLMSHILMLQGQPASALHYAAIASQLAPGEVELLKQWANLLIVNGKSEKAIELLRRDQRFHIHPSVCSLISTALLDINHCMDALHMASGACLLGRGAPEFDIQHAACFLNTGQPEEAALLLKHLVASPDASPSLLSGFALVSNYSPVFTRTRQADVHRRYGLLWDRLEPTPPRVFANSKDPNRQLRVGIVSPDLRSHSVATFIEPLFIHHDRAAMQLVVYQTNALADAVTARLKKNIKEWRVIDNISDAALAEVIFKDKIDVLIELSGHTHAHSLYCMHLRPAPVQASYLGYPNITGLSQIDWRLVDAHTDPVELDASHDPANGERFARIDPVFLCYQPPSPSDAPLPTPASADTGRITFGSFNNVQKLNTYIVEVWSHILKTIPNSRLLLKGVAFTEDEMRENVLKRFMDCGTPPGSVEILPRAKTTKEHLALYARIDIALDPIPYNGTTTTCEALWMGVPVITLAGGTHAGRVGVSLLNAVGLQELIAKDEGDYIALAAKLASDHPRRAEIRASLRAKMSASPLCDGPGFARRFHATLRAMWKEWCAK